VLSELATGAKHCTLAETLQCWYLKYLYCAIWTRSWCKALYYSQDSAMLVLEVPILCYLDLQLVESTVL
jgi:hypothetical protein